MEDLLIEYARLLRRALMNPRNKEYQNDVRRFEYEHEDDLGHIWED